VAMGCQSILQQCTEIENKPNGCVKEPELSSLCLIFFSQTAKASTKARHPGRPFFGQDSWFVIDDWDVEPLTRHEPSTSIRRTRKPKRRVKLLTRPLSRRAGDKPAYWEFAPRKPRNPNIAEKPHPAKPSPPS
jgi:hypothetical protein